MTSRAEEVLYLARRLPREGQLHIAAALQEAHEHMRRLSETLGA